MAQPVVLQDSFTRMIQDVPRDQLPPDAAWAIYDMLPSVGGGESGGQAGRLAKRGGTVDSLLSLANFTSAARITGVGFRVGTTLGFMTDNNKYGRFTLGGDATITPTVVSSAGIQSLQNYVSLNSTLVIPNDDGTTAPKSDDGTTFQNLAGSPPTCKYAAVWKDRCILGNTAALPNRTYFSGLDDPTSWDTTNSWQDTIHNIMGYAALPNALMIFGSDATARVRGSIPPPGGDLVVDDPIFTQGCNWARSIAVNGGVAVFANEQGVYITNGTNQPQDLTAVCGVKSTWSRLVSRYPSRTHDTNDVVGGCIGNYYLCLVRRTAISGGADGSIGFLFNLVDRSCVLYRNAKAYCAIQTSSVGDELYIGLGEVYLRKVSPIFDPTSSNKADAGGTAITPEIHTRYYTDTKTWGKRFKMGYLDYEAVDAATDNPTLAVSYTTAASAVETSTYTSVATLAETTDGNPVTRAKLPVRKSAPGIAFKIVQSNNSKKTVISALLADAHAKEGGRVA